MESSMSKKLFHILAELRKRHVYYELDQLRDETIAVVCPIPGSRIEIEVFEDGQIEYSRFDGDESVESVEAKLWEFLVDQDSPSGS
jgi:hypothetical protein